MSQQISLPIDKYLPEIVNKLLTPLPVILSASPGSGKTTRVPAALLKELVNKKCSKKIIVIVPKRISALSAASRIAEENNWQLGEEVGYAVRFDSVLSSSTQLIFMTDGLFLKKTTDKVFMDSIGYVFLDEFHERKSNMDLILGFLFEQQVLHSNLQIAVMSATMNIALLKKYFDQCHVIEVQAPPYEIKKIYLNSNQRLSCDSQFYEQLKNTVVEAWSTATKDILIFLPGLKEINKAIDILKPRFSQVPLEVLHGSLSLSAQRNIVSKQHQQRRIVLATNIAESSLTLPGLDCVVDCGLEKNVVTEKKLGFSRLKIDRISLFSSMQREGRAARTQDGFCFKLWHPVDERSMKQDIEPEVLSSSLHNELLFLAAIGINNFHSFSWLTPPPPHQIHTAASELIKWELLNKEGAITPLGRIVLSSPVNIINSILLIELLCFNPIPAEEVHELIARLDQVEHLAPASKSNYVNDLERILDTSLNPIQIKLKSQLKTFSQNIQKLKSKINYDKTDSLSIAIFKIFAHYFPSRIIAKKNALQGLSSNGRGVEAMQEADFYAALHGEEKNDAITIIKYSVGVSKVEALKILGHEAIIKNHVFFDDQSESFFQQETHFFGSFKLKEKAKTRLNEIDLRKTWKIFSLDNPSAFLELNSSYKHIKTLLHFLQNKKTEWQLTEEHFGFLNTYETALLNKIFSIVDSFDDFKSTDLTHYLDGLMPEQVSDILLRLPSTIKLPTGKSVPINYTDPKAPLIAAKIQDVFGWMTTPLLLNQLVFTVELLAPNMRPAQITNDLAHFWKNSYVDIRKDLRARYPKHSWPEDPTKL